MSDESNSAKGPHRGQKAMIRKLLQRKVSVPTVVTRVNKTVGGRCTPGYVRWVARRSGLESRV